MPARLELTMKNNIFIFVFCFSAYFQKATTDSETVWLKDVTTRLRKDKRTLSDPDLPDQLSFLLKRKSNTLTLNLKRNYNIDPNADIYTVRKLDDGRSFLEKTDNVEKEDVAYYQDRENGAFMTARCVEVSNGQCDILINGNIRIGDKNYDIRPSKYDFTSRNFLETTDLLGKRYVLQEQSNIERDMSFIQDLSTIERDMPVQQDQLNIKIDQSFLHDQGHAERDKTVERKDKIKKEYYVKVYVLLDSSIFDLFMSLVNSSVYITKRQHKAKKNMRRYYAHIINGVDQLYKGRDDPDIVIHVKIQGFVIFEWETHFPHHFSTVRTHNGRKVINANKYIKDLMNWDLQAASSGYPEYSQAILFTRHSMYLSDTDRSHTAGLSTGANVCVPGKRVQLVHSTDYFKTTSVAAHELGHSLGAEHDGEGNATSCKAEDGFIMTPIVTFFDPNKADSTNPWLFSKCSVEAFKKTLLTKTCVIRKPVYTKDQSDELIKFMKKLPGEKYTPSMQCQLINGRGSTYCGVLPGRICRFMYCTHPTTFKCIDKYHNSAPGTTCGINMWCQQGVCVKKDLK